MRAEDRWSGGATSTGRLLPILLLAGFFAACPSPDPVDPFIEAFRGAQEVTAEARSLLDEGEADAARETFLRALRRTEDVLPLAPARSDDGPSRTHVLNHLAYVCCELAAWSPSYVATAVRYARRALKEASSDWGLPYVNLGTAYSRVGLLERAISAYDRGLSLLPPDEARKREPMLIAAFFNRATFLMRTDELDREIVARRLLERAWKIRPDPAKSPDVFRALAELDRLYTAAAEKAREAGDFLELARVHARFGFQEEALGYLTRARNALGRTEDVRWVEARYVGELGDREDLLVKALRDYEEMIGRGESLPAAMAGWVRVMRKLGRVDEALERYGDFPEPTVGLRAERIRCRLDRIRSLDPGASEEAGREFARIQAEMVGGLAPEVRGELLIRAGFLAAHRGDADRLQTIIREFATRFPRDLRVIVLNARLAELRDDSVESISGGADGG